MKTFSSTLFSVCAHDMPFHLSCERSRRAYGTAELEQNEWMIFHNIHGYARMWWWCSRGVLLHVRASKKLGNWVVCSLEWKTRKERMVKKAEIWKSKAANIKKRRRRLLKIHLEFFIFIPFSLPSAIHSFRYRYGEEKKLVSTQREHISETRGMSFTRKKKWQKTHIIWRFWGAPTANRASYVNGIHSTNAATTQQQHIYNLTDVLR